MATQMNDRPTIHDHTTLTRNIRVKIDVCAYCGCWRWTGSTTIGGYAKCKLRDRMTAVHRYTYEQLVGPIPDGLHLDHLNCTLRNCVNPAHMEPVTRAVNAKRANETRWRGAKFARDGAAVDAAACPDCLSWQRPERPHDGQRVSSQRGEDAAKAILTEADVLTIRELHAAGEHSYNDLAARFGVDKGTIRSAVKRRSWKHI